MGRFAYLLDNPRFPHNVGATLRNVATFGGTDLVVTGTRCKDEVDEMQRIPREERMKDYAHVNLIWNDRIRAVSEFATYHDLTPVCVEVSDTAEMLPDFVHPERALYVFGPEDGSVRDGFRRACHRHVVIPLPNCLNLSVASSIIGYDRIVKEGTYLENMERNVIGPDHT